MNAFSHVIRFILIVLFMGCFTPSKSQNKVLKARKPVHHYAINQWSTHDGLASNTINQVFQSEDGYLWVTSFNGLLRFDGITFEQYNIDNLDFINSNAFYSIFQSKEGVLYFATQASGVIAFEDNQFRLFSETILSTPSVRKVYQSTDGRMWIGTNNQGLWVVENDSLYQINDEILETSSIYAITEGLNGEILVGTSSDGLFVVENGRVQPQDSEWKSISIKCFQWQDDQLLVGSTNGLYFYGYPKEHIPPILEGVDINDIALGTDGDIWFATEVGLARINGDEAEFFTEREGLPSRQISSLMFDTESNLWVSTKKSGLLRLTHANFTNITTDEGLSLNRVNVVRGGDDGRILVGSDNGDLDVIDDARISKHPLPFDLENTSIKDILTDENGNLWLATYAGVIRIDGSSSQLYTEEQGIPDRQTRVLHEDREGNIWVGLKNKGLVKLSPDGVKVFDRTHGLGSNYILSIDEMNDGTLLVGTHSGGLNLIKNDSLVAVEYPLNFGDGVLIFNTYIEHPDRVWLTTNVGLFLYYPKEKTFEHISEKDGLVAETIFDLEEDDLGFFWISSNIGLVKVGKQKLLDYLSDRNKTLDAILYDHNDGLASNDCTAAAKIYKSEDGTIWIPTLGGIVTVDPHMLSTNLVEPPVYIERICLDDRCTAQIGSEVSVSPGTRRYVIEFTALSYTAPSKVQFRYQLEGFDSEWYEVSAPREVVYTNLKPGKYSFLVQASNNDGVWNTQGASFSFKVQPYFYQTAWFFISLFLVVGGLVYARLYTIRKHNTQLKKLNTELDSFVYSTSHDLRAPLMSILGLVNIAKLDNDPKRLKDYLDNIESSVKKLDRFISDIIDYSRNSRLELIQEKVEVRETIDEIFASLNYLDPNQKIKRNIKIEKGASQVETDPRRLKIILSNIISNSFRYHKKQERNPFINISVQRSNGECVFEVVDNGQGIKEDRLDKIFDMFYRAAEDSSGSGLGLYIVKETVEKLGGQVDVSSTFDEGSTFSVHIPQS